LRRPSPRQDGPLGKWLLNLFCMTTWSMADPLRLRETTVQSWQP